MARGGFPQPCTGVFGKMSVAPPRTGAAQWRSLGFSNARESIDGESGRQKMSYLQSIKEQSVKRMLGYPSLGKQHIPHRPPQPRHAVAWGDAADRLHSYRSRNGRNLMILSNRQYRDGAYATGMGEELSGGPRRRRSPKGSLPLCFLLRRSRRLGRLLWCVVTVVAVPVLALLVLLLLLLDGRLSYELLKCHVLSFLFGRSLGLQV